MTLRIERDSDSQQTILRLIGRIGSEHLGELRAQIGNVSNMKIVIDLEEVNLVDVEAVRFLVGCEREGITVSNVSPYIREWMCREREIRSQRGE